LVENLAVRIGGGAGLVLRRDVLAQQVERHGEPVLIEVSRDCQRLVQRLPRHEAPGEALRKTVAGHDALNSLIPREREHPAAKYGHPSILPKLIAAARAVPPNRAV